MSNIIDTAPAAERAGLTTSTPGLSMLLALGRTGKHVYGGTVSARVVAERRRWNKAARLSRRANRG